MQYKKQPIDYSAQVNILKQRGLLIADTDEAIHWLRRISYFRLAEYWHPMEANKQTHQFKQGSVFEDAVKLYSFDKELRTLLFSAINDIEISLRTQMIHHFSLCHGAFWFADSALMNNARLFNDNMTHIQAELSRTHEEFIKEHFQKYTQPPFPPSWKTLEVLSFGTLSKLFSNFKDKQVKKAVAREYHLPKYIYLESWMACIAVLRNCCAHHARVWNRQFALVPRIPNNITAPWITQIPNPRKLYPILCCIAYLQKQIYPTSSFATNLKALLSAYPNVDTAAMGFPAGWENEPLWQ